MWVLTRAYNQYDQYGEYLKTVWINKPSVEQIENYLKCDEKYAVFIYSGGGRREYEESWLYLTELEEGQEYEHRHN